MYRSFDMWNAFFWGLVAASSLIVGGALATRVTLGKRTLGVIMAFGAGVLISAVAYEMVYEAVQLARGSGVPGLGFLLGAFTFFLLDQWIGRIGGKGRKDIDGTHQSSLVVPIVLAIILDGIPESMVIGLGVLERGTVSVAMLVAVFLSGFPEAVAATTGMRAGGWPRPKIMGLWALIALICGLASLAGYVLFADASNHALAFVHVFAGGAILMMLANTMIPEAYEHGGKLAGVFTVLGFAVSVSIIILEHGGTG